MALLVNCHECYVEENYAENVIDLPVPRRVLPGEQPLNRRFWCSECYILIPFGPIMSNLGQALATNFSVKALDLSHNMIGEKETYNFVRPDYTTGGEAIAEMLEVHCTSLVVFFMTLLCWMLSCGG